LHLSFILQYCYVNFFIDIYITAIKTGPPLIQMPWFSTITDANGVSHGGVGVSHAGSVETGPFAPGSQGTTPELCRNRLGADYEALAREATLEVSFVTEPLTDQAQ
jgi:hypothetical protein